MNLLELVQKVCRDSGTVSGGAPTTLVGVTDEYQIKIIDWVKQAYRSIENAHRAWRWLQGEFYGDVSGAADRYAGTFFTDFDTALPIDRFAAWGNNGLLSDMSVSSYLTATGVSVEGMLLFREWDDMRTINLRGTQTPGPPARFSVDPQDRLVIAPIPDDGYTIRGPYLKSNQTLALDEDTPEMPLAFHDCIVDAALILLNSHDEAPTIPLVRLRQLPQFSMLEARQLPRMTWGAPLA